MKNFTKGDTVEKQLASVNRVLNSFQRRLNKTIVGVVPPSLASAYVDVPQADGVLLRWIFPPGRLTYGFMVVEEYLTKTSVKFEAELVGGELEKQARVFETRQKLLTLNTDITMRTGSRLVFRTLEPDKVRKVWSGFIFQVDNKFCDSESFAIAALEEKIGEVIDLEEE